ncbi:S-layer homology domain-containing protein [Gorillibacterium timonense]|uniref:S-layer homology domain-containing protein n=1 Tax=Gorillibacterium timonense TaxID=1689269 RepID=UPI00071DA4DA|nr:S-layer homology domain-containing protein [Gorillibacterium timonense]
MKTKRKWISAAVVLPVLLWGSVAMAFSDTAGDPAEAKINALQKEGILNGMNGDRFAPKEVLTYEQGIRLLVKGFDLNIDNIRFFKEPKASDYYSKVPDNAWYAQDFIIAQFNLGLPAAVDPKSTVTREQFAVLLANAINQKGTFPTILLYNVVADESFIDPNASGSIQFLLNTKITKLDAKQQFRPKSSITRSEAADMLYEARAFVASHSEQQPSTQPEETLTPEVGSGLEGAQNEVDVQIDKISADVNKVTLTVQVPHPGYGVAITGIEFPGGGKAVIRYRLIDPDPDMFYPMVISTAKVSTYLSTDYTPSAKLAK